MLHRMLRARFLFALGLVACDSGSRYPACPSDNVCVAAPAQVEAGAPPPFQACETSPRTDDDRTMTFNRERTTQARKSDTTACCYDRYTPCPGGRPQRDDSGRAVLADVVSRGDWHADVMVGAASALSVAKRKELSEAWLRDALAEHASIAAFATLVLDLLALGAPASLVTEAQRAMGDEIEHGRIAFALASAYSGTPQGPGAWPLARMEAARAPSLVTLAREAVLEGCVGETTAAWSLHARAREADDAQLHALCIRMAEDEERHALLGFQIVAWAVATGGPDVKAAVWTALDEAHLPRPGVTREESAARRHTVDTITRDCLVAHLAAAVPQA